MEGVRLRDRHPIIDDDDETDCDEFGECDFVEGRGPEVGEECRTDIF